MSESEEEDEQPEPIQLGDLKGAVLQWEGADGEVHEVEFDV